MTVLSGIFLFAVRHDSFTRLLCPEDSWQVASLDENNAFLNMIESGSKGSIINVAQITTCVGQQNVSGKRIEPGPNGRTSAHFSKDDPTREHRGYCRSSFMTGLKPKEFFAHSMGGRTGIIDTQVNE